MKFRVEKGISVYCRNQRGGWSISRWSNMVTEKPTEFDLDDIWFAPRGSELKDVHNYAPNEPDDFTKRVNNAYYMSNYYGFHLPKNKYDVEQIVVPKDLVEIIEIDTHISESRRLARKVRQNRANYHYSFTGANNLIR